LQWFESIRYKLHLVRRDRDGLDIIEDVEDLLALRQLPPLA